METKTIIAPKVGTKQETHVHTPGATTQLVLLDNLKKPLYIRLYFYILQ